MAHTSAVRRWSAGVSTALLLLLILHTQVRPWIKSSRQPSEVLVNPLSERLVIAAGEALDRGDLQLAHARAQHAVDTDPLNPEPLAMLALILTAEHKDAGADRLVVE